MRPRAVSAEGLAWLEVRSGATLTRHATGVEVVDAAGNIRGVVGFDDATHSSIRAHMAVDTPVAWRSLLPAALDYAFGQLKKRILVGTIPSVNAKSIRFAEHVGLRETCRIGDGWDEGQDLLIFLMHREQWIPQRRAA